METLAIYFVIAIIIIFTSFFSLILNRVQYIHKEIRSLKSQFKRDSYINKYPPKIKVGDKIENYGECIDVIFVGGYLDYSSNVGDPYYFYTFTNFGNISSIKSTDLKIFKLI